MTNWLAAGPVGAFRPVALPQVRELAVALAAKSIAAARSAPSLPWLIAMFKRPVNFTLSTPTRLALPLPESAK